MKKSPIVAFGILTAAHGRRMVVFNRCAYKKLGGNMFPTQPLMIFLLTEEREYYLRCAV